MDGSRRPLQATTARLGMPPMRSLGPWLASISPSTSAEIISQTHGPRSVLERDCGSGAHPSCWPETNLTRRAAERLALRRLAFHHLDHAWAAGPGSMHWHLRSRSPCTLPRLLPILAPSMSHLFSSSWHLVGCPLAIIPPHI